MKQRYWFWVLLWSLGACASPPPASSPEVSLLTSGELVFGPIPSAIPKDFPWEAYFRVYVGDSLPEGEMVKYPVSGHWVQKNESVRFRPAFSWQPGLHYLAVVDQQHIPGMKADSLLFPFSLPDSSGSVSKVIACFPSDSLVPSNLLRVYLHFSTPMRREGVYSYLHLLDESGDTLDNSFVEIHPPLWNAEASRLSLFFHPGRIKQGLDIHDHQGSPLEPSHHYRLRVSALMPNAAGKSLVRGFEKDIFTQAEDRDKPDPESWQITLPEPAYWAPLYIRFPESLDEAMLQRMLSIRDSKGRKIPGTIHLNTHERQWSFVPDSAWQEGRIILQVDTRLEDLAGNNLNSLFETAMHKEEGLQQKYWRDTFFLGRAK